MILAVHSDTSYLSKSGARSRAGGNLRMFVDNPILTDNGTILMMAQIIKEVMSSAAEAELTALYINACKSIRIRNILMEMAHKQPPTPVQTGNSTAVAIVNRKILPKALKAMDMLFHWLWCRWMQNMFCFYWRPVPTTKGDYLRKHHLVRTTMPCALIF